jgi:hypothetical protein
MYWCEFVPLFLETSLFCVTRAIAEGYIATRFPFLWDDPLSIRLFQCLAMPFVLPDLLFAGHIDEV